MGFESLLLSPLPGQFSLKVAGDWLRFVLGVLVGLWLLDGLANWTYQVPAFVWDADFGDIRQYQRVIWGVEGRGVSHWRGSGVRENGNGPAPEKAGRVLVIGDSYTEALQVDDRETFCSLAESQLRSDGWAVELVNVGRAARSPADYVGLGPAFLRRFEPDWVVLVVDEYDFRGDSWDDLKTHFVYERGHLSPRPAAVADSDGLDGLGPWFHPLVIRRLRELRSRWAEQPPLFLATDPAVVGAQVNYPVEAEVAALRQTYGQRCSLMYVAPFQAQGRPIRTECERRFFESCRRQRMETVDLADWHDGLRAQGRAPQGFVNSRYNKGHANRWGHRMIAQALAAHLLRLREQGKLPGGVF